MTLKNVIIQYSPERARVGSAAFTMSPSSSEHSILSS